MVETVIVGAARTPMGAFQGELSSFSATELGAIAIKGTLKSANIKPYHVDELLMGCVLPAGLRQAPARQAGILANLPKTVPAVTVNKVCGSGMKTIIMACDQIKAGSSGVVIAGGMESMSNAPYISESTRAGKRLGHTGLNDHMFTDGLEDAFQTNKLMGHFAEDCATKYQFTRGDQDDFAIQSLRRAIKSQSDGVYKSEIVPINLKMQSGEKSILDDEQPRRANIEKIPFLKPAFQKGGSITAANASSISDGAAAVAICSASKARQMSLPICAKIIGYAGYAHDSEWFTTAPIYAVKKLLSMVGWTTKEVDLWEVNEAFAVVPMAFMRDLDISGDRVNIRGGACALGHPIGASGARIVVTLLNALQSGGLKKGIAAICLGGGEALAVAIERA
jgi:acetyl-CoA C-acetyltransferase